MAGKRIDPRLRAEFKEQAREIIGRDRAARSHGWSQNTIGEIERALVRAFQLGQELGTMPFAPPRPEHLGIDWEEVKPRGREVLMGLTYRSDAFEVENPIGLRRILDDGRTRWANVYADGRMSEHSVASGSVDPLVRLGLLAPSTVSDETLALTAKGRATCEAYWRRRADGDRTLPKESIRA